MTVGVALGIGGLMLWQKAATYEECVIGEMRGQDRSLLPMAAKLCMRRFKVEVSMPAATKIDWFDDGLAITARTKFDPELLLVRATLSFSTKDCASSSNTDFSKIFEKQYASEEGVITLVWLEEPRPLCMRSSEAFGRYR